VQTEEIRSHLVEQVQDRATRREEISNLVGDALHIPAFGYLDRVYSELRTQGNNKMASGVKHLSRWVNDAYYCAAALSAGQQGQSMPVHLPPGSPSQVAPALAKLGPTGNAEVGRAVTVVEAFGPKLECLSEMRKTQWSELHEAAQKSGLHNLVAGESEEEVAERIRKSEKDFWVEASKIVGEKSKQRRTYRIQRRAVEGIPAFAVQNALGGQPLAARLLATGGTWVLQEIGVELYDRNRRERQRKVRMERQPVATAWPARVAPHMVSGVGS
jgi:hypothetical protein